MNSHCWKPLSFGDYFFLLTTVAADEYKLIDDEENLIWKVTFELGFERLRKVKVEPMGFPNEKQIKVSRQESMGIQ